MNWFPIFICLLFSLPDEGERLYNEGLYDRSIQYEMCANHIKNTLHRQLEFLGKLIMAMDSDLLIMNEEGKCPPMILNKKHPMAYYWLHFIRHKEDHFAEEEIRKYFHMKFPNGPDLDI